MRSLPADDVGRDHDSPNFREAGVSESSSVHDVAAERRHRFARHASGSVFLEEADAFDHGTGNDAVVVSRQKTMIDAHARRAPTLDG